MADRIWPIGDIYTPDAYCQAIFSPCLAWGKCRSCLLMVVEIRGHGKAEEKMNCMYIITTIIIAYS